jgi:hypothetical protein
MTIGKTIGRKISVAEMGWNKPAIQKAVLTDQENAIFLARFVGVVTGLKPYRTKAEGDKPSEVAFGLMGQFEGQNADGETKDGSVLYLPGYVNDMIVAAFNADDTITSIRVAFDVYASYDETSATSYVFTVNDLLNVGSKSVDEVKAEIKALPLPTNKALPAPKK